MISFEEAGQFLGLAAARDQRTVGDADILAWHADLNAADVTFDDASAALTRFYAIEMASLKPEDRRRVTSPDIINLVRKIRAERLANFVYEPPPGDSDPNYLARLRKQLGAIASGQRPPAAERPALEGPPHPTVVRELTSLGRAVPDEDGTTAAATEADAVRRRGPLGVACPSCKAAIGRPCKAPSGKQRPTHSSRDDVAHGRPLADPEEQRREMERRREASRRHLEAHQATEDQAS